MNAVTSQQTIGAVLFTDLVGFTEYNDVVGDAAALEVLEVQTALASKALDEAPGARIVKELGDGLMLWCDTAAGGLAVATSFHKLIERARDNGTFPLAIRMGMHHGDALPRGDDVVGQTVNIAARVSAIAGPGELLVSDQVIAAAAGDGPQLHLEPVGPTSVKGVREAIWLNRLVL